MEQSLYMKMMTNVGTSVAFNDVQGNEFEMLNNRIYWTSMVAGEPSKVRDAYLT